MVSEEEMRLVEMWQFFDRHGFLPFEKKRIDVTLSKANLLEVEKRARVLSLSKSEVIDSIINSSRGTS